MKIEEYPCVKIKRLAQERIRATTGKLDLAEQLAWHRRSFEALCKRREELSGRIPANVAR
jgi:hypothetical protein